MIPKTIHYCWLSDDPYPPKIQACIDTWSKHCPDYEIRLWTLQSFGDDCPVWVRQAFERKKYAFAADYVRCYALYHFGGIYLDSDVEIIRPFPDELLRLPHMLAHEGDAPTIEAAVMGAEPGHPLFGAMLEYYRDRPFVRQDGSLDITPIPKLLKQVTDGRFRFVDVQSPSQVTASTPGELCVLPSEWFSPISLKNMEMTLTPRTVTIHHFVGSWKPASYRWKKKLQQWLGPKVTNAIIHLKDIILRRK